MFPFIKGFSFKNLNIVVDDFSLDLEGKFINNIISNKKKHIRMEILQRPICLLNTECIFEVFKPLQVVQNAGYPANHINNVI